MLLKNTDILMKKKLADNDFDSYGILVSANGEEAFIHSDNVDLDTYFDIASMGKVLITAQLILKAVDRGWLTIDDTLDMFFDNVPPEKRKITVKQMLTHTSGIIRIFIPREIADQGRDVITRYILAEPLAFEPGCGQIYSCNAYILLGFIAEKLYKKPLDEIFEEEIKKPLGLTRSRFNIAVDEPNAAHCYKREHIGEYRVDDENAYSMRGIGGNGAQFWTMRDIRMFIEAVLDKSEKLYSKNIFDMAEKNYVGSLGTGWGLGYLVADGKYPQVGRLFKPGSFGHCGHTGTSFFIDRENRMYVIILTNATRFLNKKNNFNGYDYDIIEKMRADIHNEILKDIEAK